jgi:hypothetical protein
VKRFLVLVAVLALAPAAWAGVPGNGAGSNGVGSNGFPNNGADSNGLPGNGFSCNGFDANGFNDNIYGCNGFDANGYDPNAIDFDGTWNALVAKAAGSPSLSLLLRHVSKDGEFELTSKGAAFTAGGRVLLRFPDGAAVAQARSSVGGLLLLRPPDGDPAPVASRYTGFATSADGKATDVTIADGVAALGGERVSYRLDIAGSAFHLIGLSADAAVIASGETRADGTLHGVLAVSLADGTHYGAQLTLTLTPSAPATSG